MPPASLSGFSDAVRKEWNLWIPAHYRELCRRKVQPWVWPGVLFKECCVLIFVHVGVMLWWPHAAACHWNPLAALSYLCWLQKGALSLCTWSCRDREGLPAECSLSGMCSSTQIYLLELLLLSLHGNVQHAADAAEGLWWSIHLECGCLCSSTLLQHSL